MLIAFAQFDEHVFDRAANLLSGASAAASHFSLRFRFVATEFGSVAARWRFDLSDEGALGSECIAVDVNIGVDWDLALTLHGDRIVVAVAAADDIGVAAGADRDHGQTEDGCCAAKMCCWVTGTVAAVEASSKVGAIDGRDVFANREIGRTDLLCLKSMISSSCDCGLYGEPGFDASSLDVALESVQLSVATPLQTKE